MSSPTASVRFSTARPSRAALRAPWRRLFEVLASASSGSAGRVSSWRTKRSWTWPSGTLGRAAWTVRSSRLSAAWAASASPSMPRASSPASAARTGGPWAAEGGAGDGGTGVGEGGGAEAPAGHPALDPGEGDRRLDPLVVADHAGADLVAVLVAEQLQPEEVVEDLGALAVGDQPRVALVEEGVDDFGPAHQESNGPPAI